MIICIIHGILGPTKVAVDGATFTYRGYLRLLLLRSRVRLTIVTYVESRGFMKRGFLEMMGNQYRYFAALYQSNKQATKCEFHLVCCAWRKAGWPTFVPLLAAYIASIYWLPLAFFAIYRAMM